MTSIKFLGQEEMSKLDTELMEKEQGFSVDQLMELAGLSCACCIQECYPPEQFSKVLIVAGPGNNGGDGLACARHLKHFGYTPSVLYPKKTNKDLYQRLTLQCVNLGIQVHDKMDVEAYKAYNLIVDGIFGYSFKGTIRAPFDQVIKDIKSSGVLVAAIDIPSGWDVEGGNTTGDGLDADLLISLTAPKACAHHFKGRYHYLGGRFVPPTLAEKYQLNLPKYKGSDQFLKL